LDIRNGQIYDTLEEARKAGVAEEFLVTGERAALETLRKQILFQKGIFRTLKNYEKKREVDNG
jgi:hypothetical protein